MDKNRTADDAKTDLMVAAKSNNLDKVNKLLFDGADPNLKDKFAATALHHSACEATNVEISKLLISYGTDCNAVDVNQETPLHTAAGNGHEKKCQLLLQHGADCNALDVDQSAPLHFAAGNGCEKICQLLVQHGADPKIRSKSGYTSLDLAKISKNIKDELMRWKIIALLTPLTPNA